MDARRRTALTMLEYHAWATAKTIEAVEALSHEELTRDMRNSHSSVFGTLVHIYNADWVWLRRLSAGESPTFNDVPPVNTLPELQAQEQTTQAGLISYAGGSDDADWTGVLEYRLISGASGRSPVFETLLHVANHGSYHRGQVVTMLRQMGAEPIPTDLIRFIRAVQPEV